jgi:hypothetical protein
MWTFIGATFFEHLHTPFKELLQILQVPSKAA